MEKIIKEYEKETWKNYQNKYHPNCHLKETQRNYIIKYFSGALFTLISEWFVTDMPESIDNFTNILKQLINDSICNAYQSFCKENEQKY